MRVELEVSKSASAFFSVLLCFKLRLDTQDAFEVISMLNQTEILINSILDSLLHFIWVSQPSHHHSLIINMIIKL